MQGSLVLSVLLAVLGLSSRGALSHGGGLHRWTFINETTKYVPTATIRYDVHTQVASCSAWKVLNTSAVSPSIYPLPFFPATLNMTVEGSINIYSYLGGNCTSSPNTLLNPLLKFSVWVKQSSTRWTARAPQAGSTAFAYGFTGSCSAPGNLYRNNLTLQDSRFNLAWWGAEGIIGEGMNTTDNYPGYLWGAAPQSWFTPNGTSAVRLASIVLIPQAGPTFCCNVDYTGYPAAASVLAKGKNCAVPAPH